MEALVVALILAFFLVVAHSFGDKEEGVIIVAWIIVGFFAWHFGQVKSISDSIYELLHDIFPYLIAFIVIGVLWDIVDGWLFNKKDKKQNDKPRAKNRFLEFVFRCFGCSFFVSYMTMFVFFIMCVSSCCKNARNW